MNIVFILHLLDGKTSQKIPLQIKNVVNAKIRKAGRRFKGKFTSDKFSVDRNMSGS
jgi:hypothetical protein